MSEPNAKQWTEIEGCDECASVSPHISYDELVGWLLAARKRIAELEAEVVKFKTLASDTYLDKNERIAELEHTLAEVQNCLGPADPNCDGCSIEISWALDAIKKAVRDE